MRKYSAERPWVKGQVLVTASLLKSLIPGDTAVWFLAEFQHSSSVQDIQICVHAWVCLFFCFCVWCMCKYCIQRMFMYILLLMHTHSTCHRILRNPVWVWHLVYPVISEGWKKLGLVCGSRGVVWMNAWRRPKITNPLNNPDWPRHKACLLLECFS